LVVEMGGIFVFLILACKELLHIRSVSDALQSWIHVAGVS
jgi:hypothetical protein